MIYFGFFKVKKKHPLIFSSTVKKLIFDVNLICITC